MSLLIFLTISGLLLIKKPYAHNHNKLFNTLPFFSNSTTDTKTGAPQYDDVLKYRNSVFRKLLLEQINKQLDIRNKKFSSYNFTSNKKLNDKDCGFECWLENLMISIPPISTYFETEILFITQKFNVSIPDMEITNIKLDKLNTKFYPNNKQVEDGIFLDIKISARLKSSIKIDNINGIFSLKGKFDANATGVNINIALKFEKGADGMIQSVSIYDGDKCGVKIDDLKIEILTDTDWINKFLSVFKVIVDMVANFVKDKAGTIICDNVEPLIDEYGTLLFDNINTFVRPYIIGPKPIEIPIDMDKMADLRKSSVIDLVRYVLTNLTTNEGPLNLNNLINRFTNNTGTFNYEVLAKALGLPLPLKVDIPIEDLNATVKVILDNLILTGLNTWNDFTFFDPITPYVLDTHTGLKQLGINLSFTVNVSSHGIISTGDQDLTERAILYMHMEENALNFQFQLATLKGAGSEYSNAMCTDINCLIALAEADGTGITKFELNTLIDIINLEAANGSLAEDIQNLINLAIELFIDNYKEMIPPLLNGLISEYGTTFLNEKINETLTNKKCDYIDDPYYSDIDMNITIYAFSSVFVILLIFSILLFCITKHKKKANNPISGILVVSSFENISENIQSDPMLPRESKLSQFWRTDSHASLFMSPYLPHWVRVLMPTLVFMNIALFLSSNSGVGASIFIKMTLGDGKKFELPSMFNFGLINSIKDMWKAKTYALSILIAVMSCIWPYTKLVLILIVWILPSTILKKSIRAKILRLLDELGKWSLLDSFVMILMLVAFHFALYWPIVNTDDIENQSVLYVWVYAAYGFITLMIGTVFSLALSHIICFLDRHVNKRIEENDLNHSETDVVTKISVYSTQNLASKIFLCIFLASSFVLFIFGIASTSFTFQFVGLTGWALDLLDTPFQASYTVLDLGYNLPQASEHPNTFGIRFTQLLYFVVAVVVPMLHIVFISVMFFIPMTKIALHHIYVTCETLYAWSCLEVFIISLLATIVEIGQFTQFMVGDRCDMINPILSMFFKDEDFIKGGHEKCFEVVTYLEKGSFLLVSAAVIHTITTMWIHGVSRKRLREEETSSENKTHNDGSEDHIVLNSNNFRSSNLN